MNSIKYIIQNSRKSVTAIAKKTTSHIYNSYGIQKKKIYWVYSNTDYKNTFIDKLPVNTSTNLVN